MMEDPEINEESKQTGTEHRFNNHGIGFDEHGNELPRDQEIIKSLDTESVPNTKDEL